MNIFMQFIYCFLIPYIFSISTYWWWLGCKSYMGNDDITTCRRTSLNCSTELDKSRIAGVDNEQMTGRVIRYGCYGWDMELAAIKEQFKTPSTGNNTNGNTNGNNSGGGLKGFVTRAKSVINPTMNLSAEKDYNGNVNPIRNVMPKEKNTVSIPKSNGKNKNSISNGNKVTPKSVATGIVKGGAKATSAYLGVGAKMAEGNFDSYSYKKNKQRKNNFQHTEYINNLTNVKSESQKSGGDNNEHNKYS